jgi:hypothetical protein
MSKVAKYGKFVHLEKLLQGTFRAAVASIYKDSKLTAAQQDDENRKSSLMPPTTRIGVPTTGGMHYAEPIGRVTRTTEIRRAYYMMAFTFCTDAVEPKFAAEFAADARLLIHDPATFGTRVCNSAQSARPNWTAFFAPVHYFDPENGHPDYLSSDPPEMRDTLPWRLKENRYAWQREWRFIWLPDTDLVGELSPIEFPIGPLSDIAVLERLKPSTGASIKP